MAIAKKIGYSLSPCKACGELHKVTYAEPYAYRSSVFAKHQSKHPEEFDENGDYKLELVPWAIALLEKHND
ncbi:MAG: hypothetical protein DRI46_12175 [Chloroflexi bacterium]|nr:MAG: hypothetical protein DRI46_12175 [Chloroflexota bacterium]